MIEAEDSTIGGAGVQDDACAAVFSSDEWQRRVDATVCNIRLVAAQMMSGNVDVNPTTPGQVVEWNMYVSSMFGVSEDPEEVQPYAEEKDDAFVKVRMVYHFRQMSRGDFAAVCNEVAELWTKAGIARRVSEAEFARVSAIIEAHAKVPLHAERLQV